jgi:hypothetical protein
VQRRAGALIATSHRSRSSSATPLVMQVNPSFPAKTVPEFISYVKSIPGKISYGSGGIGTSIHVASELFKMMAEIDMIHVPYRGGAPAMTDLMAGQVQVVFNPVPELMEFIRALGERRCRRLAVRTSLIRLIVRAARRTGQELGLRGAEAEIGADNKMLDRRAVELVLISLLGFFA